jgi:hypothetical protein
MDCVALGDQGAVLMGRRLGCEIHAAARRTAFDQAAVMRDVNTGHAIISLGDNKPCAGCKDPNLLVDLWRIRSRVKARTVTWILPRDIEAATIVEQVAQAHRDRIVLIPTGKNQ